MIQIRNSIFETNSSSTHALCMSMNDFYRLEIPEYKQWRKQAKPLHIIGGEYGRSPQKPLIELEEKANYLWTAVLDCYSKFHWDNENNRSYYTCTNKEKIEWWKQQILNELPENSTLKDDYYDKYDSLDFPWIDHAAQIENFIKICENDSRYIHCLLDDNSFIEISGDEYPNFITAFLPHNEEQIINMPGRYSVYIKGN